MFVGVDGTGPKDQATYSNEMSGSFVSQIYRDCIEPEERKAYFRGPTLWGTETGDIANRVVKHVLRCLHEGDRKIFLAGYSRGGAAVVIAAERLARDLDRRDLGIEALFLFDAVDRDLHTDSSTVPGCVKKAYHALRSPAIGSRSYFDNAARVAPAGVLEEKWFAGTHAALGGLPWTGDKPDPVLRMQGTFRPGVKPDGFLWQGTRRPVPALRGATGSRLLQAAPGSPPPVRGPTGSTVRVERLGFAETNDRDAMRHVRGWMWPMLVKHGVLSARD